MSARSLRSVIGMVVAGILAGCSCKNEVRSTQASPDGQLQATVYARSCDLGATVGDHVHVAVLKRGRLPGDEDPNVLSADAGHDPTVSLDVNVSWETPTRLVVEIDPKVRFFRRHERARGVEIVYRPLQGRLR